MATKDEPTQLQAAHDLEADDDPKRFRREAREAGKA